MRRAYFSYRYGNAVQHRGAPQTIDNGIVNIEVGFAPLKSAEFVILKIQQIRPSEA